MKKLIWFVVLVAVAAAVWWWGLPAYRAHKEKKFAAQAAEAFQKQDFRRAWLSARQALALNPNQIVACRVMADLADSGQSPHALAWRARVAQIEPTIENKLVLASCAMRYEQPPFVLASQTLQQIASEASNSAPFHVVLAQLALRQNRIPAAERAFEEAIRLDPTNELNRLNLAVVRLQFTNQQVSATARAQLEGLAAHPSLGVHALRSLTVHDLSRKELDAALDNSSRLLKHPGASFVDRVQHLSVLHAAKKPEFESYLQGIQVEAGTNAMWAAELGARLLALHEPERAMKWLTGLPPSLKDEHPVPLTLANAYVARGDWPGLEAFLSPQNWKEQEFLRLALLARAVRQQKDESVAKVHWQKAAQLASERAELLNVLAQIAGGWGWKTEVEELMWRAVKRFPNERWPMESLHATYTRERNTHGLLALYALAIDRDQSTNVVVRNNYAALALLVGTNVARAHDLAEQVYRFNRTNAIYASTYAWSLHMKGQTGEALKLMETIAPAKLSDPALAVYYGSMLTAAGQKEKAKEYLDKTDGARLLPEEKLLVDEARRKL